MRANASHPRIGLALGGGSARGLAHILMLEAFDDLGIRPARIAGTSIGAIMGGQYAAGLSAAEIKAFAEDLLGRKSQIFRRLSCSMDGLASLWTVRMPSVVDGVTLFELLLPKQLRTSFDQLRIPFSAVTTDYVTMSECIVTHGPVIPAIAASAALPTILRPVTIEGRVLVDGGFVNPTPFDVVQAAGDCDVVVAVDVTGMTRQIGVGQMLSPIEAWIGSTQIMFHAIVREKAARRAPDIFIRPEVGTFSTLDFLKFREIFAASEPAKDELKRALEGMIENVPAAI